jgi:hypothetical protein
MGFKTQSGKPLGQTLRDFGAASEKAAQQNLEKPAEALRDEAKSQAGRPGSGRTYRSRTGHGVHQASAPGQPPAPDTHTLQQSIHLEHPRPETIRVIADAEGAAELELGSRRMAPRPFLRTALEAVKKTMTATFKATLRRGGK